MQREQLIVKTNVSIREHGASAAVKRILSQFWHLTFVTKYSRKRHKGCAPIILSDGERMAVAGIIDGTAAEFGYKVLAANILPDHVHLLIADMGNSVAEIMKIIKGRSARAINAARGVSSAGSGRRGHVWAEAYSDTEVRSEEQLANTIKYISDQYVKHAGRWGVLSATPDLSRGLQKGERQIDWKEYEYRTHERVI